MALISVARNASVGGASVLRESDGELNDLLAHAVRRPFFASRTDALLDKTNKDD